MNRYLNIISSSSAGRDDIFFFGYFFSYRTYVVRPRGEATAGLCIYIYTCVRRKKNFFYSRNFTVVELGVRLRARNETRRERKEISFILPMYARVVLLYVTNIIVPYHCYTRVYFFHVGGLTATQKAYTTRFIPAPPRPSSRCHCCRLSHDLYRAPRPFVFRRARA